MPTENNRDEGTTTLPPDDAFSVVGNESRMDILQVLGEADNPLTFSELRERVGIRDSGQFNYHLDQLRGHFVRQTDDGYDLLQAGRRVVEAVLSGAVTELPDLEPTQVEWPCPYCDAPTEVTYDATTVRPVKIYCTECAGAERAWDPFEDGQLAALGFSPAGTRGRSPRELLEAAATWEHLENLAMYNDVCPRCSGVIEHTLDICEDHDSSGEVCSNCNRDYATHLYSYCTNCIFDLEEGYAANIALGTFELLAFLIRHDINPLTDAWGPVIDTADEEILSMEPPIVQFTFTIDDDTLSLTIGDELSVTENE